MLRNFDLKVRKDSSKEDISQAIDIYILEINCNFSPHFYIEDKHSIG